MSTLTIATRVLAFEDQDASSDPQQRLVNWNRCIQAIPCDDPQSRKYTIAPMSQEVVFDGQRSVSIDGTTAFAISLHPLEASRYRITWTGGAAPGFRTDRGLDLSGQVVTMTVNSNLTVTASVPSGTPFSSVQEGDVLFIPSIVTGDDISPFGSLNVGYWTVLAATATTITAARISGAVFEGADEAVSVTAASQFQVFSTSGVQVGDAVTISAGFALSARRSFVVTAVNPSWIEFVSTSPLAPQAGVVPGASGMTFFTNSKRFVHVEGDQEFSVRLNGAADDVQTVEPWVAGDVEKMGTYQKCGPCWKLVIVNKSAVKLNVIVLTAE